MFTFCLFVKYFGQTLVNHITQLIHHEVLLIYGDKHLSTRTLPMLCITNSNPFITLYDQPTASLYLLSGPVQWPCWCQPLWQVLWWPQWRKLQPAQTPQEAWLVSLEPSDLPVPAVPLEPEPVSGERYREQRYRNQSYSTVNGHFKASAWKHLGPFWYLKLSSLVLFLWIHLFST